MLEIVIQGWDDLQKAVFDDVWDEKIMRYRANRIYRGAADKDWRLVPSLNRVCAHDLSLEQAVIRSFRKYGYADLAQYTGFWQLLPVAQHYGLPTRLLDWSYSPLVAAHFATEDTDAYDRDGALIHCNPAASELLERSADECVYAELFEPLCPFEKVMAMQRSDFVASELTVGERTVELYFAPFSDEERGGVLVVLHDVTQQRKAEERRREFVANVSHELRTPLTNIRSYAETIRDAGDELPRELENSFLDIVINESDRMTHIVQDLLTLSRLDSGRSEMNMARFDFGAAIDSVLRSIELEARRHGHELTHDYHDLPMIMGDRGRIEQVMLNVLGNAVKYTPDGGHIRVTAGTVGERVWMEVADDGIGIPKADRSRIFERFYRVDKARSRESGGTGLGLSIATEIVQRHNGTLSLVDREGPGTTVRLELPIRQSEVGGAQEGGNG